MSGQVEHTRNRTGRARPSRTLVQASANAPPVLPPRTQGRDGPRERNTMIRKSGSILLASVLASLIASVAFAVAPCIDRREARQHGRIVQGGRSGELTRPEAMRLRAGQRRIHRAERRAEADGFVSLAERRRIARMQDRESRRIYRRKHNARERA